MPDGVGALVEVAKERERGFEQGLTLLIADTGFRLINDWLDSRHAILINMYRANQGFASVRLRRRELLSAQSRVATQSRKSNSSAFPHFSLTKIQIRAL